MHPMDENERQAQLMSEIERVVGRLMSEVGERDDLTLSDIEGLVLKARTEISEQLLGAVIEEQGQQQVPGPVCPECGQEMRYKGQKRRRVQTTVGEVELSRAYYYCEGCRSGFFPPG